MKRSPWFNAKQQPPVNGEPYALYEHRCWYLYGPNSVAQISKQKIVEYGNECRRCEWRGLLREKAK